MSVQAPVGLRGCWIVLNPLQSSAPLAVGLEPAAAGPVNKTASATANRRPTNVAVTRRRDSSRLMSPSRRSVLRSGARPKPAQPSHAGDTADLSDPILNGSNRADQE